MRPLLVGLTGTLGAGKSTATTELARLGAATASADEAAHALSAPGGGISRAVKRLFGPRYLRRDGSVDRAAVAERVFADAAARRRLEAATHPLILREVRRKLSRRHGAVAVVDVPLLFEAGLAAEFDVTVTVSAPKERALRRVATRGLTRAQALARMRSQWSARRKEGAADVVWRNAGTKTDFLKLVRRYHRAWDLIARSPK